MTPVTMGRVGNPKKEVRDEDVARIRACKAKLDAAQVAYRHAVIEAMNDKASYREVSRLTGLATSTLRAWKNGAR